MNDMMIQAIVLFIFALLIGFIIGYLIKNSSSKVELEEDVASLENDYNQSLHLYEETLQKESEIQNIAKESLLLQESKSTQIENLRKQEEEFIQKIAAIENDKKNLTKKMIEDEEKIRIYQDQEKKLSSDLELVTNEKEVIDVKERQIEDLEKTLESRKNEIEKLKNEIASFKSDKLHLKEAKEKLEEKVINAKYELKKVQEAIEKIEQKYKKEIDAIIKESEELKIKAINYEYALKEHLQSGKKSLAQKYDALMQKLFALPKTKGEEIEKFVKKNDGARVIDKILTLFKKRPVSKEEV